MARYQVPLSSFPYTRSRHKMRPFRSNLHPKVVISEAASHDLDDPQGTQRLYHQKSPAQSTIRARPTTAARSITEVSSPGPSLLRKCEPSRRPHSGRRNATHSTPAAMNCTPYEGTAILGTGEESLPRFRGLSKTPSMRPTSRSRRLKLSDRVGEAIADPAPHTTRHAGHAPGGSQRRKR